MRFSALIVKNLARRPARTCLTLMALSSAIGAVVALLGIASGFTRSFEAVYTAHAVDVVVSRQGTADRLSSSVDQNFVEKIGGLPDVSRCSGVLLETLSIEEAGIFGIPSLGIEPSSWLLDDYRMEQGQRFAKGERKSVLLGTHLAQRMNAKRGETIRLFDEPYKIAGVFESSSTWENGSMVLPLRQLQELTDRIGQVTYVNVKLEPPMSAAKAESAIREIQGLDPRLLALATDDFVASDTRMQLAGGMAWMTSVIALAIGAIGTLNTMMTSVFERTREIGILRAIGWPKWRVVSMILAESCGLALLSSFLGIALAMATVWLLSQAPAAKGILSPSIDARTLLHGISLAIGIGVLGAMIPAWRAAQLLPTEAFRDS